MEVILAARLEVPFWCSFKVPHTVNVHFTYPVPPLTTLYGLICSALGYPADYYDLQAHLAINVGVENSGQLVETYSKIIKWDRRDAKKSMMRTLVIKQKLYRPVFNMYVGGESGLVNKLAEALKDPAFPLYIGESDDVVEIKNIAVYNVMEDTTAVLNSCVPMDIGAMPQGQAMLVHLPVSFKQGRRGYDEVVYRNFYVAPRVELSQPVNVYRVGDKMVVF